MILAKYLRVRILNLTGCYFCLTDVFFKDRCIKKQKTNSFIFSVSCALKEKSVKKFAH